MSSKHSRTAVHWDTSFLVEGSVESFRCDHGLTLLANSQLLPPPVPISKSQDYTSQGGSRSRTRFDLTFRSVAGVREARFDLIHASTRRWMIKCEYLSPSSSIWDVGQKRNHPQDLLLAEAGQQLSAEFGIFSPPFSSTVSLHKDADSLQKMCPRSAFPTSLDNHCSFLWEPEEFSPFLIPLSSPFCPRLSAVGNKSRDKIQKATKVRTYAISSTWQRSRTLRARMRGGRRN